jgi:hypothetical protein
MITERMSLNQVSNIIKNRKNTENSMYNRVYENVRIKINSAASVGYNYCTYYIPQIIIGCPLIDVPKTKQYILNKLSEEGFIPFDGGENIIHITWNPESLIKKKESRIKFDDDNDDIFKKLASIKNNS